MPDEADLPSTREDRVGLRRLDAALHSTVLPDAPSEASASGTRQRIIHAPRERHEPMSFGERYAIDALIGRGGMGEVRTAGDGVIGREIAIKTMRSDGSEPSQRQRWRFLREARIQGQLEHPAVVPVYDLGVTPAGEPYFTMKRVRGESLAALLNAPKDARTLSERQQLTRFSSLCLAVHYVHSRGVLHRDLKPANVMLGPFGEVYLLDWGLAKVLAADDEAATEAQEGQSEPEPAQTLDGEVLGTPGYMAPEQLRGEAARVDHRVDVYSLGAILFELLSGHKMHGGDSVAQIMLSTLTADGLRPSERAPDAQVPPELDELCVRATRLDPDERLGSAKELSDAIEAYLDGARDSQRRRELARAHVERAHAALEAAQAEGGDEAAARAEAMREVTSALGLDPRDPDAIRALVTLLTEPPRTVPREAERRFLEGKDRILRASGRTMIAAFLAYAFYIPFPIWMGMRDWWAFAILATGTLTCIGIGVHHLRTRHIIRDAPGLFVAIAVTAALSTVLFGPLILVPVLALSGAIGHALAFPERWVRGVALSCGALVVPVVLHALGVLPDTLSIDGAIVTRPWMMSFPRVPTTLFVLVSHVAVVATAGWYVARAQREHEQARRALHVQAWHLEQIVPEESREKS